MAWIDRIKTPGEIGDLVVGNKYFRSHGDRSHRKIMMMIFRIDKMSKRTAYATELLTNQKVEFSPTGNFPQEFENIPLSDIHRLWIFNQVFEDEPMLWDQRQDTGWQMPWKP